jgi:hypothetical protein
MGFAVAAVTALAAVSLPGVASGAPMPEEAFTDTFDGSLPLTTPWVNPGNVYQQSATGVAFPSGAGAAWRDTGAVAHQITIPAYKITDPTGPGNSIGGVTVAVVDQNNYVGFEVVKTTSGVLNSPESKTVLSVVVGGAETRQVVNPHPAPDAFEIDDVMSLRLRREGRTIEAFLNGVPELSIVLDDVENEALEDATRVGLINLFGPNNYDSARGDRLVDVPPTTPPPPTAEAPTVLPPVIPPVIPPVVPGPGPTTAAPTTASPQPTPKPTSVVRTFTDAKSDLALGADLRSLKVTSGKTVQFLTTHKGLTKKTAVGVNVYVDTNPATVGPEFKVSTVVGQGTKVSVNRVKNWVTKKPVTCTTSRTVSYDAETVRLTMTPSCLGTSSSFRLAAEATQSGQRDWAPDRRTFYASMPRTVR